MRRVVMWSGRTGIALLASTALLPLVGCVSSPFFTKTTTTTTTTTGTGVTVTNTGDFAYVANSAAGTTYLSEYSVANNSLSSLGAEPLGYIPVALAVAPSNSFLYVASTPGFSSPGVYVYTIGSTGVLSGGTQVATDTVAAMTISPDGNWLFTVNNNGLTMNEYKVNTSSGALTLTTSITLPASTCNLTAATPVSQSCSVAVSPSQEYVVAALGIAGDAVLSYTSADGITGTSYQTISSGYSTTNPTGDFSVALDGNNYAYVARTSSLSVFGITSSAITGEQTTNFPTGYNPRSITLSKSYNYVYTANEDNNTVSGFGVGTNGSLTALSGSNYPAPTGVSALAIDNSGSYLVAVGYDANAGVQLYSLGTNGVLKQVAESGSGTDEDYPALVAMTH